ncbi:MAG: hypothetical protein ACI4WT_07145 [Oligosphaeraceae bacterium]
MDSKQQEQNMEQNMEQPMEGKAGSGRRAWLTVTGLTLGLACMVAGSLTWRSAEPAAAVSASSSVAAVEEREPDDPAAAQRRQATIERLQQMVREQVKAAERRDAQTGQDTLRQSEAAIDRHFNEARGNVEMVVDHFTSFKVCTKLSWKLAKDKICDDSHEVQDAIQPIVEPNISRPCMAGYGEASHQLRLCQQKLQASGNQLSSDLIQQVGAMQGDDSLDSKALGDFYDNLEKVNSVVMKQATTTMGLAVGTAIDVACIQGTIATIKVVVGWIAGRMVSSAGTATVMAAADGPLPIGDIVAAGFLVASTAWAGYDLYQVTYKLPEQMRTELISTIEGARREAKEELRRKVGEMQRQQQQQREKLEQQALQALQQVDA